VAGHEGAKESRRKERFSGLRRWGGRVVSKLYTRNGSPGGQIQGTSSGKFHRLQIKSITHSSKLFKNGPFESVEQPRVLGSSKLGHDGDIVE
jgi:hypothetical protein